jgi:hypothetical protein
MIFLLQSKQIIFSFNKINKITIFLFLVLLLFITVSLIPTVNADGIFGNKEYVVGDTAHIRFNGATFDISDVAEDSFKIRLSSDTYHRSLVILVKEIAPDAGIFELDIIFSKTYFSAGDLVKAEFLIPGGIKIIHTTIIGDDDGIHYSKDNCLRISNFYQEDRDNDGIGDYCDKFPDDDLNDPDDDGIGGRIDNCPDISNPKQEDRDDDEIGDICDKFPKDPDNDKDNDGISGIIDNCPKKWNRDQLDNDKDGLGNVCDDTPDPPDWLTITGIIAGITSAVVLFTLGYRKNITKTKRNDIPKSKDSKLK